MVIDFIKSYAQLIASHPEAIDVKEEQLNDNFYQLIVYCDKADLGKLIGKNGNMISALKTVVNGSKAKSGNSYKIQVFENK